MNHGKNGFREARGVVCVGHSHTVTWDLFPMEIDTTPVALAGDAMPDHQAHTAVITLTFTYVRSKRECTTMMA